MNRKAVGDLGETAVCRWLEQNGHTIRCRNFRIRGGEIDIIAERGGVLCFVEVRARRVGALASGDETVDPAKQARIIRAAYRYIEQQEIDEDAWTIRYDIASVELWQGAVISIDYLENAFDESDFSL
jgi:putative endonuclease